ncbi:MAG: class I SAM-dependent methyltransferase [Gaiellaceae bacterium]
MSAHPDYLPFPNLGAKNVVQERFELPVLDRLLGLPRDARILEVGCGRGVALASLSERCRPTALVGLDVDPTLLAEAAKRLQARGASAVLYEGDVRRMPFDDASFDVVMDFGTAYHVARPERALAEIERVLRVGGLFVYESPVSQLVAHPIRGNVRRLPWRAAPALAPHRRAVLWSSRAKQPVARRP